MPACLSSQLAWLGLVWHRGSTTSHLGEDGSSIIVERMCHSAVSDMYGLAVIQLQVALDVVMTLCAKISQTSRDEN